MVLPTTRNLTAAEEQVIRNVANQRVNGQMHDGEKLQHWLFAFQDRLAADTLEDTCAALSRAYVLSFYNAYLAAWNEAACTFCGGRGHEHKECMTLIKWTRKARDCGLGFHFGALKGIAYYRARQNQRYGNNAFLV